MKDYSKKNTLGLTMASFGHCIFISLTAMALPMFFTDELLIDPKLVSLIFLVTRVWDAFNDPMMGSIVDRTKTKWGKCRPYLLYSAIPLTILTVIMFSHFLYPLSEGGKFAVALITYVLFITSFTALDIPLCGIKPLLYNDTYKRNKGMSTSTTFGSLGSLFAVDLFFIFVVLFGGADRRLGYFITVLILASVGFITIIGGFFTVKEVIPVNKNKTPFIETFKQVFKNKHLIVAMTLAVFSIVQNAYGVLLPYFAKWNLADSFSFGGFSVEAVLIPILATATGVFYMIAVFISPYLLKKFRKKPLIITLCLLGVVLNLISYAAGYSNLFVFMLLRTLPHITSTFTLTIGGFMLADALDYTEYTTGQRTEGTAYAVNNLLSKVVGAVFVSMIMFILGVVGYNAAVTVPALDMGESMTHNYKGMLDGIFAMLTLLPAIGSLLQVVPMLFFKLDEDKHKEILDVLLVRRQKILEEGAN